MPVEQRPDFSIRAQLNAASCLRLQTVFDALPRFLIFFIGMNGIILQCKLVGIGFVHGGKTYIAFHQGRKK